MADDKPIIVIKKKGGHGGHHGGAWKVAYADFVTAMMAFFMVMWLVNSAETKTKKAIASYFRRPGLFESGSGTPLLIGGSGMLSEAFAPPKNDAKGGSSSGEDPVDTGKKYAVGDKKQGTNATLEELTPIATKPPDQEHQRSQQAIPTPGSGNPGKLNGQGNEGKATGALKSKEDLKGIKVDKEKQGGAAEIIEKMRAQQQQKLEEIAKSIEEQMKQTPELKALLGLIDVTVDADGLTIDIMDTEKASMFRSGSAQIQPTSIGAFEKVAGLLKGLPNKIDIMGHTDAKPFTSRGGMSNWELSADRANAARRILEQQGIPAERITSVVGRSDRELRFPEDPFNPSNRRITLKVKFDLKQIKKSVQQQEAFRDFGGTMPEPEKPSAEEESAQEAEQEHTEEATIEETPVATIPPIVATAGPTIKPTLSSQAYRPRVEIHGKEKTDTVPPPPDPDERKSGNPGERSQPTIFKNDPVIGPINPFFGTN